MAAILILVIITTSSDFRLHDDGGYFVDVRVGSRRGRQMTARNPATIDEALGFVDELRAAAARSGKAVEFEIHDEVSPEYRGKGRPGYAPRPLPTD